MGSSLRAGLRRGLGILALLCSPLAHGTVADEIARIEAMPGTSGWDREVAFHLRVAFDDNGSGAIDRRREVRAIPCEVLVRIDTVLAERSQYPGLMATYGFPRDLVWLGHALGFHRRVRRAATRRMEACGLVPEGPGSPVEEDELLSRTVSGMVSAVRAPGSPPWTRRMRVLLLVTYDRDASDALDTPTEIRAIGCPVWRALDEALAEDGGLVTAYGLRPGDGWGGGRLGIAAAVAADVQAAAGRCQLRP